MELKGLQHRLIYANETHTIPEPQGFDNFSVKIKRNDYHGMSAQFSEQTLGFYGEAAYVITTAYQADIDSSVTYRVLDADSNLIYEGKVDLATFSMRSGKYLIVECKVAEINAKTIFNNRTDIEVDLNSPKTIDGNIVESPDWLNLHIPMKHLVYTNKSTQKADITITSAGGTDQPQQGIRMTTGNNCLFFPIGISEINEFGHFEQPNPYVSSWQVASSKEFYYAETNHTTEFGSGTVTGVEIKLKAIIKVVGGAINSVQQDNMPSYISSDEAYVILSIVSDTYTEARQTISAYDWHAGQEYEIDLTVQAEINAENPITFYLSFESPAGYNIVFNLTVRQESYIKMTMYDNLAESEPVNADMLLVHDALNIISHSISENALSVKSNWYRTEDSHWNAGTRGNGALKALTNGYHIRGLFTDTENERNMPMSFKTFIQSLDAMDCIGWGFSTEQGATCIRVERWDWFYKNDILLFIDNPSEITRTFNADGVITKFVIGYKKYETNDEFNSIDSIHGERTFASGIKAVANEKSALCDFIADNYAIEKTRRAKMQLDSTKEFSYDESDFVFELVAKKQDGEDTIYYEVGQGYDMISDSGNVAPVGIGRPSELLNANISPRNCAGRWREFLFAIQSTSNLKFTTGTINNKAGFATFLSHYSSTTQTTTYCLYSYPEGGSENRYQNEDDDITQERAKFVSETIEVEYPISVAQYNAIVANPYGRVILKGTQPCWIKKMTYTFVTGLAKFTLIPQRITDELLEELTNLKR